MWEMVAAKCSQRPETPKLAGDLTVLGRFVAFKIGRG